MTDSQSFDAQRIAVLQSHLQVTLTEVAELEAIIERAEQKIDELDSLDIPPSAAHLLRTILADSTGHTLKQREATQRSLVLAEAAAIVIGTMDDHVLRADNDHADAARRAFNDALRAAHARLLNASKVADPNA